MLEYADYLKLQDTKKEQESQKEGDMDSGANRIPLDETQEEQMPELESWKQADPEWTEKGRNRSQSVSPQFQDAEER